MSWSIVIAVVALGAVVLVLAATADRKSKERRRIAESGVPERVIPKLPQEAGDPTYVTAEQALAPPAETPAEPDALAALLTQPALPARLADDRFAGPGGHAWVDHPIVLVADDVPSFRALLPVVERAVKHGRGLAVISRTIDSATLDTLLANHRRGHLACLVARCQSADDLASVADAAEADVLSAADLASGWVPETALGDVGLIVATRTGLLIDATRAKP